MKKCIIYNDRNGKGLNKHLTDIRVNGILADINIIGADPNLVALVCDVFKVTGQDLDSATYMMVLDLMIAHGYGVTEVKETILRLKINGGGKSTVGSEHKWGNLIVEAPDLNLAKNTINAFNKLIMTETEEPPTEAVINAAVELIKRVHELTIDSIAWTLRDEDPVVLF